MAGLSESGSDYEYDDSYTQLPTIHIPTWQEQEDARKARAQRVVDYWRSKEKNSFINQFRDQIKAPSFQTQARMEAVRTEVTEYFTHRYNIRFLKTMGSAFRYDSDGPSLFEEKDGQDGKPKRRFIVKHAPESGDNEVTWLRRLQGFPHIVNLLHAEGQADDFVFGLDGPPLGGDPMGLDPGPGGSFEFGVHGPPLGGDPLGLDPGPGGSFEFGVHGPPLGGDPLGLDLGLGGASDPGVGPSTAPAATGPATGSAGTDAGGDFFMRNADNGSDQNDSRSIFDPFWQWVSPPPPPPPLPSRAVMILEYLEGGDLGAMRQRFREAGRQPPIRFLWMVLGCLARACVAMAYHPYLPKGENEKIPDGKTPLNLVHTKLDPSHVLIGQVTTQDGEHMVSPIFKVCSFGGTELRDFPLWEEGEGIRDNMLWAAKTMQTIALPFSEDIDGDTGVFPEDSIDYTDPKRGKVLTAMSEELIDDQELSPSFKWAIARMMAISNDDPLSTLKDVLRLCETRIFRPEACYPGPLPEFFTDEAIMRVVFELVLSAPVDPPTPIDTTQSGQSNFSSRLQSIAQSTATAIIGGNGPPGPPGFPTGLV
ncbi:putative Protein kinase domain-containing protein [Seiridium cardinale]|uniref:Protein kinase domain-containing protein n=1 Tax=Seiridium cardinale TaxID=138064 RepID=A0ABR2XR18_9PEZI